MKNNEYIANLVECIDIEEKIGDHQEKKLYHKRIG